MRTIGMFVGGILGALLILFAVAGLCRIAMEITDDLSFGRPKPPLLMDSRATKADWPVCVRINPGPLIPPPEAPEGEQPKPEIV